MKTFSKIVLGFFVLIGIIVGIVFYATADLPRVAEKYFLAASTGDYETAQEYLNQDFLTATPLDALKQFMEVNALDKYKDADWGERSISSGTGKLSGTISTDSGATIPVSLSFVKESDGWKIQSINKQSSGAQYTDAVNSMPGEAELVELAHNNMMGFLRANQAETMEEFYVSLSALWKSQFTLEKINDIYSNAYPDLNLDVISGYRPQFTSSPRIEENGWLEIEGFYTLSEHQLHFRQKYIKEGLSWKLVGFDIQAKRIEPVNADSDPA